MSDGPSTPAAPATEHDEHVRVRRGATTAFIGVDVSGAATGATLLAAAVAALGLPADADAVRLLRDDDRAAPLKGDAALSSQGVAVDDLVWAVSRIAGGGWEVPLAPPESKEPDSLASKVPAALRR
jgi:hypothetical protein